MARKVNSTKRLRTRRPAPSRGTKKAKKVECEVVEDSSYADEMRDAAAETASELLGQASQIIYDCEAYIEDDDQESIENALSELDCIRDSLEDCAEDGWDGFRSAIEDLSNEAWNVGLAWPQNPSMYCDFDLVSPDDVENSISSVWILSEDADEIREMSDRLRMTFKEMVHDLLRLGKKHYAKRLSKKQRYV